MVMDSRLRGNDRWGISDAEQGIMNVEVRFFTSFGMTNGSGGEIKRSHYGN